MRRVLFITHDFGRLGAQMMLLHLIRNLRMENPSWQLRILGREPNGDLRSEFAGLVPVETFWKEGVCENPGQHQQVVRRELTEWSPHVIYSNTSMNGDVTRFLDLPAPLVVHVHEMSYYLKMLDSVRREALVSQPSSYLAASQAVKNLLVKQLSIPEDQIRVLYESLDLEWIDAHRASEDVANGKAWLGVPESARLVGTVGRIDERKGWDLFARTAMELLSQDVPTAPWYFLWLGHGPCHEDLSAAFGESGWKDRLIAPGARANPFPYYAALDFFVQTSREDPCPLTTLEAAYLALPVVVFGPSGGAQEVVGRGCGIVLPRIDPSAMAEALRKLARLPDRGRSLGTEGPTIIRKYHDARQAAKQVSKFIEELISERADSPL